MTYCLAAIVDEGIVFASDSRTNAGVDQVSTYRKMHRFEWPGERVMTILSAGNLATTQSVLRRLQRDIDEPDASRSLQTVARLDEAAEYVGEVSVERQGSGAAADERNQVSLEATFILGGQIAGQAPELYLVYPQGNFITVSSDQTFFQIGETKYGKPILDRFIRQDVSLDKAALCALVSLDSTMRSNLSVGPPVDLLLYEKDRLALDQVQAFEADDRYFMALRDAWGEGLGRLFATLPPLPAPAISS